MQSLILLGLALAGVPGVYPEAQPAVTSSAVGFVRHDPGRWAAAHRPGSACETPGGSRGSAGPPLSMGQRTRGPGKESPVRRLC